MLVGKAPHAYRALIYTSYGIAPACKQTMLSLVVRASRSWVEATPGSLVYARDLARGDSV